MEQQITFRDRQELQAADFNDTQRFSHEALTHVVADALTANRHYIGAAVSATGATQIRVELGRLYQAGEVFAWNDSVSLDLFEYLPLATKRMVSVVVWGQEADVQIEPRDFLLDLATGQTEPQAVAMRRDRLANVNTLPGAEAADPQPPVLQVTTLEIARVVLTPGGIESITMTVANRLPNLGDHEQRTTAIEGWRAIAEPRISTLSSDVAALAQVLVGKADIMRVRGLAADIGRLKEAAMLPDIFADWGADHLLDEDESDIAHAAYSALVDEGIRFPWAGQAEIALALFNPYNSAVRQSNGMILPQYSERARLSTVSTVTGDVAIGQYQYQTSDLMLGTATRQRIRYGATRTVCTNSQWWQTGFYDPNTRIFYKDGETFVVEDPQDALINHRWLRLVQYWVDTYDEPYWWVESTTHTINGSRVAQTLLNAQNGWLTGIDLYFTVKDATGPVTIILTETKLGLPDLAKAVVNVTLQPAAMNPYPAATQVAIPPTFLRAGTRYAIVLVTGGDHRLATVDGTVFTQGTLFYGLDGDYYQGDATKDLMFALRFANFSNPRTVVDMNPIMLAGGIADLDFLHQVIVPPSCELHFEYQVNGLWRTVGPAGAAALGGLPAMLPLRAVFVGSNDVMPGLWLTGSRLRASRPGTTFVHYSAPRVLANPTSSIEVQLLLEGWNAAHHTCTPALEIAGQDVAATSVVDEVRAADSIMRRATFALGMPTSSYRIKVSGTTDNALVGYHVAERVDVAF